jgi:hypothetical protein
MFRTEKNSEIADDGRQIMIKWLLDTGASIHAEKNGESVLNEKPCNSTVNIADRNSTN